LIVCQTMSIKCVFGKVEFPKNGLKPPTSVGKDFNCAPQAL
jgi:hypothetical protein